MIWSWYRRAEREATSSAWPPARIAARRLKRLWRCASRCTVAIPWRGLPGGAISPRPSGHAGSGPTKSLRLGKARLSARRGKCRRGIRQALLQARNLVAIVPASPRRPAAQIPPKQRENYGPGTTVDIAAPPLGRGEGAKPPRQEALPPEDRGRCRSQRLRTVAADPADKSPSGRPPST